MFERVSSGLVVFAHSEESMLNLVIDVDGHMIDSEGESADRFRFNPHCVRFQIIRLFQDIVFLADPLEIQMII